MCNIGAKGTLELIRGKSFIISYKVSADLGFLGEVTVSGKIDNGQFKWPKVKYGKPKWMDDLADVVKKALGWLGDKFSDAFNFAADLGKKAFNGIKSFFGGKTKVMKDPRLEEAKAKYKKMMEEREKNLRKLLDEAWDPLKDSKKQIENDFQRLVSFYGKAKISHKRYHEYGHVQKSVTDEVGCMYKKIFYWTYMTWKGCRDKIFCKTTKTFWKKKQDVIQDLSVQIEQQTGERVRNMKRQLSMNTV